MALVLPAGMSGSTDRYESNRCSKRMLFAAAQCLARSRRAFDLEALAPHPVLRVNDTPVVTLGCYNRLVPAKLAGHGLFPEVNPPTPRTQDVGL